MLMTLFLQVVITMASHHFQTRNLSKLKYFLGIEVAQSNNGIVISQKKYALDILEETD